MRVGRGEGEEGWYHNQIWGLTHSICCDVLQGRQKGQEYYGHVCFPPVPLLQNLNSSLALPGIELRQFSLPSPLKQGLPSEPLQGMAGLRKANLVERNLG